MHHILKDQTKHVHIVFYQEQIVNKKQQKGGFLSKDLQRWSRSGGFW
jgi:hypothetical protein